MVKWEEGVVTSEVGGGCSECSGRRVWCVKREEDLVSEVGGGSGELSDRRVWRV